MVPVLMIPFGFVDAFRALHPRKEGAYTWWGPKNNDRAENRGSRLDYFLVSGELLSFVQSIKFHRDTQNQVGPQFPVFLQSPVQIWKGTIAPGNER